MRKGINISLFLFAVCLECCTKRYNPQPVTGTTNYLVVQGVIAAGNDSTKIQLGRTVLLNDSVGSTPVTGAQVMVQGNDNSSYPLIGNGSGTYSSAPLKIDISKQYRLYIKTNGVVYQSDYVPVKVTPPIDTVMREVGSNGLNITLNTHDAANNTRYYRWDYTETWQFHAEYNSAWYSNGDTVLARPTNMQIYNCYNTDSSNNILLGTSAKLTQDVIASAPITAISTTSEKIETEYSIIVRQYALTSDAYSFWSNLKKNTEQLGSIFDAQPSQINGNIHRITNPSEPVIGYVSASTIQAKRIFVLKNDLPSNWVTQYPYTCALDSFLFVRIIKQHPFYEEDDFYNYNKGSVLPPYIPVSAIGDNPIVGHTGSTRECVDCTIRGTTTKPSFWQ